MSLKSLWGKSEADNFRNRRNLAFWSAIYSLLLWPNILIFLNLKYGLEPDLVKALLTYVFTLAGTSIGGYLWAAIKDDNRNATPPDGKK